ncbi:hypothetical protein [Rickettsiella endosymbiont of Dermanyssus gallinae]|uniref:hypothetical protein n=1 Tax=Rickettsiella endosymbiont of Dermanyssus gallinae TaxID=2856608 RepID=UPI001C52CB6B|nr:hypothetical protein [Rickettsiella endosymbiont of Dermanyssus gallinae]
MAEILREHSDSLEQILPWVKKLSQTEIDSIVGDDAYLTFIHKKGIAFTSSNNSAFFQVCRIADASVNPSFLENSSSLRAP